jgi:hypothetical protein
LNTTIQDPVLSSDSHRWIFPDGRSIYRIAGGDDGAGEAAVAEATEDTESQESEVTPDPSQPKAKEQGPAPWAKDLEDLGLDDPEFDKYLRDKWQPRMTQVEQEVAKYSKIFGNFENAEVAAQVLTALDDDPVKALKWLSSQLEVDPIDLLEGLDATDETEDEPTPDQPEDDELAKFKEMLNQDPRMQHVEKSQKEAREAEENQALEDLTGKIEKIYSDKGDTFNKSLFLHLLKSAEGDADLAYSAYEEFHTPAKEPDDPPPTAGGKKGVTPREEPQYGSLGEAVNAYASDARVREQAGAA